MRFRHVILAAVMGVVLTGTLAVAAPSADYLAQRAQQSVLPLDSTTQLAPQLTGHAGQVVELEGAVSHIIIDKDHHGFQLQVNQDQQLDLTSTLTDPDLMPGRRLRVLARVDANAVLTALAVTGVDQPAIDPPPVPAATPVTDPAATVPPAITTPAAPTFSAPSTRRQQPRQRQKARRTPAAAPVAKPAPATRSAAKSAVTPKPAARSATSAQTPFNVYVSKIRQINRGISTALATQIARTVVAKSQRYGVDPRLVLALIAQESRFNPRAVSPVGARGLGQLMPGTAALLGVLNAFDITQNIDGTVRYLAAQLKKFGGDIASALAAYNAGPGNVVRFGGIPPFRETRNYVRVISTWYQNLVRVL